ncbi:hypothetical protein PR202_gb23879 [Eleusine coracana subsp. coracana]|uniref:Retrotransposon gag domain-containing protein n=1 Tax=Eleusine coracana subsp. coracana TaxID=191504 RepID=A0AAV5FJX3_ELECO|nr:hypothetical protein PR202_gb23879 [Eleusine coracana subsp. coracana]
MVRTRNQDDPESSQQGANAQPSLAEILATVINRQQNEAELLRQLVENTSNLGGRGGNRNNNQPRQCTYSDFFWVPIHRRLSVPGNLWTRIIGCVRPSPSSVCWTAQSTRRCCSPPNNSRALVVPGGRNYEATLPAGCRLEWSEFKTAFRAHFIPAALMQRKLQEFTDLKQGGRNVLQYSEAFNHLAQYASEYVNTEEKKRYAFLRGMNAKLKERLTWQQTGTYNDLVNAAIVQEGAMRQVEEEDRKRKAPASASETAPGEASPGIHLTNRTAIQDTPAATIPAPVCTELPKTTTAAEPSFPCAIPAAKQSVSCTVSAAREPKCSCPTAC